MTRALWTDYEGGNVLRLVENDGNLALMAIVDRELRVARVSWDIETSNDTFGGVTEFRMTMLRFASYREYGPAEGKKRLLGMVRAYGETKTGIWIPTSWSARSGVEGETEIEVEYIFVPKDWGPEELHML